MSKKIKQKNEMKLFAVYLGGHCDRAFIEVHDVVFIVAKNVESALPELKNKWFGQKEKVHVDSWVHLSQVDGYDISLENRATQGKEKLYFLNIGFYRDEFFGEEHRFVFLVGKTLSEVRNRAKIVLKKEMLVHVDNSVEIDGLIQIIAVDGRNISLTPAVKKTSLVFNQTYWPIP